MRKLIFLIVVILLNFNFVNAQWQNTNFPYSDCINCFAVSDTNIYAGTVGGGVFFSNDNGTSWVALNNGLTNLTVASLLIHGSNIFAGTNGGGVFLSTNSGNNWTAINNGLTNLNISSLATDGTNVYAGTYNGTGSVFITSNTGSSWTLINNGLPSNAYVTSIAVSGSNIFVGLYNQGGVYLSSNNGALWTAVNSGLTNKDVMSLMISGTDIFAGIDNAVYLSNNNGGSWNLASNGLTNIQQIWQFAASGTTDIYVGTWSSGVFHSTTNGSLWTPINTGLSGIDLRVVSLAISGTTLFAGVCSNYGAIWKRPLSEITSTLEIEHDIPFLVYPNPSTGTLKLESDKLEIQNVEVYNLFGEKVFQTSNINHQIENEINLSFLSKGVYLVRVYDESKGYDKKIVIQ